MQLARERDQGGSGGEGGAEGHTVYQGAMGSMGSNGQDSPSSGDGGVPGVWTCLVWREKKAGVTEAKQGTDQEEARGYTGFFQGNGGRWLDGDEIGATVGEVWSMAQPGEACGG